jgi:hypothetical protein
MKLFEGLELPVGQWDGQIVCHALVGKDMA